MSASHNDDRRLIFRNTMKITPGHADQFRQAIVDAVEFAEAQAPQVMVDVFIDEAEQTATSFQIYADSDAVPLGTLRSVHRERDAPLHRRQVRSVRFPI